MAKILLATVVLLSVLPVDVLDIMADPGGRIDVQRIGEGIDAEISYVHSVELTPVYEAYRIDEEGIHLQQMKWQSTGAGLPDSYEAWENGYYISEQRVNLGRRLEYWFIPASDPIIRVNGRVLVCGLEHSARIALYSRTMPLIVHLIRSTTS